MSRKILDKNSLAETLWRLEEVRLNFKSADIDEVEEALEWLLSRQGGKGSYGESQKPNCFYAPTKRDIKSMQLPTGEKLTSPASNKHILGEETLRTLVEWKRRSQPETKRAIKFLDRILDTDETGMGKKIKSARESGWFCCGKCTPAFLRTVNVVKSENWEKTLDQGIFKINSWRTPDGRWHRYPFYFTLFMLAEAESPHARTELIYAQPQAEKLIKRYQNKSDRSSRFRAHVLEASLNA